MAAVAVDQSAASSTFRLLDLPGELIDCILGLSDQTGRHSLLCGSRRAARTVEPALYRHARVRWHAVPALLNALQQNRLRYDWLWCLTVVHWGDTDFAALLAALFASPDDYGSLRLLTLDLDMSSGNSMPDILSVVQLLPALTMFDVSDVSFPAYAASSAVVLPRIVAVQVDPEDGTSVQDARLGTCASFPNATRLDFAATYLQPPPLYDAMRQAVHGMQHLQHLTVLGRCQQIDRWLSLVPHPPSTTKNFVIGVELVHDCDEDLCPWSHMPMPSPEVTKFTLHSCGNDFYVEEAAKALDGRRFPSLQALHVNIDDFAVSTDLTTALGTSAARAGLELEYTKTFMPHSERRQTWYHWKRKQPASRTTGLSLELRYIYERGCDPAYVLIGVRSLMPRRLRRHGCFPAMHRGVRAWSETL